MRIKIDMDWENNKVSRPGTDNTFYLYIRRSTKVRLASLKSYLEGQTEWDETVLACVDFFDHLIRQFPSENMLAIKRNFYNTENPEHKALNRRGTLSAVKGIYAAVRMNSSMKTGGLGLGINVDVTNTAFWRGGQPLIELAENYIASSNKEWQYYDKEQVCEGLKPAKFQNLDTKQYIPGMSDMFRMLRRFHKCHFHVKHRGKSNDPKTYTIKGFVWDPKKFGWEGANARNYRFLLKKEGREITVADYFLRQYNIRLMNWQWPLIETTRDGVFPMDVVIMKPWQRYNFKLNAEETSAMIKFAVTRPPVRQKAIMQNVNSLRWADDPYLREFGVKINPQMQPTPARVLQNPVIQFGRKTIDPRTNGRWDLRDQTFAEPNPRPLKSWSIVVVDGCVDAATALRFGAAFADIYRKHGGKVETMQPKVFPLQMARKETADDLEKLYQMTGNANKATPDLIFFVLPDKFTFIYERLKKNMEIRFATLTQMVNCDHVKKCQPQYCSNVAMKVNAKLGGYTSRLAKVQFYTVPTMVIGVDVSHGGAGSQALQGPLASMAAMTMSMDRDAIRYQAVCQTNGHRVEVLTPANIKSIFPSAVRRWCQKNQRAPEHVFYFRDGVAEGQFAQVMENEVKAIRSILEEVGRNKPKITVIVATKRHHIRFFPGSGAGDKNGNPLPGTVVEHEVTHPFHFDFYLCSHVAIQGTARPVHYHVLHDEIQYPVDKLQAMIYQQCYQYMRSTTPVSIHPAIYYAHLAAARARAHEDIEASKKDPDVRADNVARQPFPPTEPSSRGPQEEAKPLLKIGGDEGLAQQMSIDFFKSTMWYI